ncbi:MAG: flagellar basal body rod protein FlgB [Burkholderiaceae bacterium]|jgi:flagellar basal-body rod protein FlgB|nr:flagellar basal body rod protein FlgB [Burkholderiaceae bacterium]
MFDKLTSTVDFHGKALVLRAERQRTIASNIANADTPGYVARDLNFKDAMSAALSGKELPGSARPAATAHPAHLPLTPREGTLGSSMGYAPQVQPALDNNSVDLDRERGNFVDNAVRYESTLRFINGSSRTILSAISGQ